MKMAVFINFAINGLYGCPQIAGSKTPPIPLKKDRAQLQYRTYRKSTFTSIKDSQQLVERAVSTRKGRKEFKFQLSTSGHNLKEITDCSFYRSLLP